MSRGCAPPAARQRAFAGLRHLLCGPLFTAALAFASLAQAQAPATFEIRGFSVEGNTVLSAAEVDAVLVPYAGNARSLADVQAAVAALQALYARAGFAAVRVVLPEQQVASGSVRIEVIEVRLRQVRVDGPLQHFDAANVRRSLPALRPGATPNTDDLARQIRLANENPARQLSVDLRSESGQLDAAVSVLEDKPWKVGATFDDTGSPSTGRNRVGAFFQHANVADLDHVATLQYVTSPDRPGDVTIAALNYRIPLPALGDSLDLYGIYADVDSGVVSDLFNVRGRGTVAGARFTHALRPTAGYQHRWIAGLERRKVDNRIGLVGASPDLVPDVVLQPASLGYAATRSDEGRRVDASITAVRNLPTGHQAADIAAARAGTNPRYSIVRYAANAAQSLPEDWQLGVAVDGQYTSQALVSAEQFGIGGHDSVRGFLEREVTGDRGIRASVEIRTPNFGEQIAPGLVARAHLFSDRGWVRRNHALPGETETTTISSLGVGLRATIASAWQLRLDAAHVMQGATVRPRGDERLHFSIGYAY
ncbi:MAG: ShlB/FhaC/HecB family hemolysin secretion/activation protein [Caldimonas sp.]